MTSGVKKIGRDNRNVTPVERIRTWQDPIRHVHHTHDHSRLPRPSETLSRPVGDAVPAESIQVSGETAGLVEAALRDGVPRFAVEDRAVKFSIPKDVERLALSIIVQAGKF